MRFIRKGGRVIPIKGGSNRETAGHAASVGMDKGAKAGAVVGLGVGVATSGLAKLVVARGNKFLKANGSDIGLHIPASQMVKLTGRTMLRAAGAGALGFGALGYAAQSIKNYRAGKKKK